MKNVQQYNKDFLRIVLDIPIRNISMEEKLYRYMRDLKSFIWKELCIKKYRSVTGAMKNEERVHSANKGEGSSGFGKLADRQRQNNGPVTTGLGMLRLQKLTPEAREQCHQQGLCFRCWEQGRRSNDLRCQRNARRN